MSSTSPDSALRRMIDVHRKAAPASADRAPALERAWGRALRHAATPFNGLQPEVAEVQAAAGRDLDAALSDLPEHGLIAALEDDAGRRGLLCLGHGALDALIEVQTTGRVETQGLPPRPVTRIDEALSRDFIDLALSAFARETGDGAPRDWPDRLVYGSRVSDRAQLTLLMPEQAYHVVTARLSLGGVGREGVAVLVLPADPAQAGMGTAGSEDPPDPAWQAGLHAALAEAPVTFDAVLMRLTRPLGEVEALAPGDLIAFDPADLSDVALETEDGRAPMRGRLGQIGGRRALRLHLAPAGDAAAPTPPEEAAKADGPPAAPPVPAAGTAAAAPPVVPSPAAAETASARHPAAAGPDLAPAPAPAARSAAIGG